MKLKYASIDIETSSIEPEWGLLLELGIVVDNNKDIAVAELPTYRFIFLYKTIIGQSYALNLNKELIEHIEYVVQGGALLPNVIYVNMDVDTFKLVDPNVITRQEVKNYIALKLSKDLGGTKFNVAGKNVAGFDLPWLKAKLNDNFDMFRRRVMDPAPYFVLPDDEFLPSLQTCLDRAGTQKSVEHTAVADAQDVASLLRIGLTKHWSI